MASAQSHLINDESSSDFVNYSDAKVIIKKLERRCRSLETLKRRKISVRQHLLAQNKKNKLISESLSRVKSECEILKSDLSKTLFFNEVTTSKQKISSTKKLDEFLGKRKNLEQKYRKSPMVCELEELVNTNAKLSEKLKKIYALLELTKRQYVEISVELQKNFRKKVCEFCDTVLGLKAN